MIKFEINRIAKEDIDAIKEYLTQNNALEYFEKLKRKISGVFDTLKLFPLSGTEVKSDRFKNFRFTVADKYLIFYTFSDNVLTIQTIIHSARNYIKVLKNILPQ